MPKPCSSLIKALFSFCFLHAFKYAGLSVFAPCSAHTSASTSLAATKGSIASVQLISKHSCLYLVKLTVFPPKTYNGFATEAGDASIGEDSKHPCTEYRCMSFSSDVLAFAVLNTPIFR